MQAREYLLVSVSQCWNHSCLLMRNVLCSCVSIQSNTTMFENSLCGFRVCFPRLILKSLVVVMVVMVMMVPLCAYGGQFCGVDSLLPSQVGSGDRPQVIRLEQQAPFYLPAEPPHLPPSLTVKVCPPCYSGCCRDNLSEMLCSIVFVALFQFRS